MIGIFQDNELHITPLSGILKMQPQLDYLEKGDKRAKDDAKAKGEGKGEPANLLIHVQIHSYRQVLNL